MALYLDICELFILFLSAFPMSLWSLMSKIKLTIVRVHCLIDHILLAMQCKIYIMPVWHRVHIRNDDHRRYMCVFCCRSLIYARLDNTKCAVHCFTNTDEAAQFMYQSMTKSGWSANIPIKSFKCKFSTTLPTLPTIPTLPTLPQL